MTNEEYGAVLERRLHLTRKTADKKGQEYGGPDERLHNFKKAARMSGKDLGEAWYGMVLKHWVSITDVIDNGAIPSQEWIDEKIGDMIVYLTLLEGIYTELNPVPQGREADIHYEFLGGA
jgi:hypothetical protein